MKQVLGNLLAVVYLGTAMQWFAVNFWLMCSLSIIGSPSYPNAISIQYANREVVERYTKRYFIVIGVVFFMMLFSPAGALAWAVASQVCICLPPLSHVPLNLSPSALGCSRAPPALARDE